MPSLAELQTAFADAVFGAPRSFVELIGSAHRDDAAKRFEIYRNAIRSNYRDTLVAIYPVVQRLVGNACFAQLCVRYVRSHPSTSGDLHEFGAQLPTFIADDDVLSDLGYLDDVARLEWALHRAFHAPEQPLLTIEQLAHVAPDQLSAFCLRLVRSAHLIRSHAPIVRIWEVNQLDVDADAIVHLDDGAQNALVIRRGRACRVERLEDAHFRMLDALHGGATLAQALDRVAALHGDFDLAAFLHQHITAGTISGLWLEEDGR